MIRKHGRHMASRGALAGPADARFAVMAGVLGLSALASCGDGGRSGQAPPGATCGGGTMLVDGKCVPTDSGTGGSAGTGGAGGEADASAGDADPDTSVGGADADGPDSATDTAADVQHDVLQDTTVQPEPSEEAGDDAADVVETGPSPCQTAQDCDDAIACTVDACASGVCKHWPQSSGACAAGQICDPLTGCVGAPVCSTAAQCEQAWSSDPCKSNIACESSTATCTFTFLDGDGDGHPPLACGGDDCNDAAKNVYPGQAEGCNEIDDDCNGAVDDGTLVGDCCPSTPMFANFDTACGGPTLDSEEWACGGTAATVLDFPTTSLPVVIRTPSHPGRSAACAAACADPEDMAWAFSVGVTEAGIPDSAGDIKVTVAPPWRIRINTWPPQYCLLPLTHADCAIGLSMSYITFTILTTDPDAPAANVLFERVPQPGSCP